MNLWPRLPAPQTEARQGLEEQPVVRTPALEQPLDHLGVVDVTLTLPKS